MQSDTKQTILWTGGALAIVVVLAVYLGMN